MKNKIENLYLQLWRNPIFYNGLLHRLTPTNLHTLIGLSSFLDKKGSCFPSLKKLQQILGLKDVGSVSRRIKSLEKVTYKDEQILKVERKKEKNNKGIYVYSNNHYSINSKIVTIFLRTETTLNRQEQQMEKVNSFRENY